MEKTLKLWFYPHDFKFRYWLQIFVYHFVDCFIDTWDYIGGFIDTWDYIGGGYIDAWDDIGSFVVTQGYIWESIDICDEFLQSAPVWSCGCRRQIGPVWSCACRRQSGSVLSCSHRSKPPVWSTFEGQGKDVQCKEVHAC